MSWQALHWVVKSLNHIPKLQQQQQRGWFLLLLCVTYCMAQYSCYKVSKRLVVSLLHHAKHIHVKGIGVYPYSNNQTV